MKTKMSDHQRLSPEEAILNAVTTKRPAILLLGQDSANAVTSEDAFLRQVGLHLQIPNFTWDKLLGSERLPESFYRWLAERFARNSSPEWLSEVAGLPWSAIFTSSLDGSLREVFTLGGREPQEVLTSVERPVAMRSTARTPLYYLFGRAGVGDPLGAPPNSRAGYRTRLMRHATPMLNRLSEITTALGLLVVDRYSTTNDWLPLESLLASIDEIPDGQIVWCGYDDVDDTEPHRELRALIKSRRILATPERLGTIVANLVASGRIADMPSVSSDESGVVTIASDPPKLFVPSASVRLRAEAVASIVDDSWTTVTAPSGSEARYIAFREFHGDSHGMRALLAGISIGFAIKRDFEHALWEACNALAFRRGRINEPIILHGQSGTGKTIALARLTFRIRTELLLPVLLSSTRVPQAIDLEAFCEEAERAGAALSVIICDCNSKVELYWNLVRALGSRGRRVLIVGSSYRSEASTARRSLVLAPEKLSQNESSQLTAILSDVGFSVHQQAISSEVYVLPALYRFLPASRPRLATGLGREARATESELRARGQTKIAVEPRTLLAEKLMQAGLVERFQDILSDDVDTAIEGNGGVAGRLIDLVMVAGRLNCPVPMDLLIRAVRTGTEVDDINSVARLFAGLDLFRIREAGNEGEELYVAPRLAVEAELVCQRRILGAVAEGDCLVSLIRAARISWDVTGSERRFVLDLIQKLRPDGPVGIRYKESYLAAAGSLASIRATYGVADWSLMLQESTLRRDAIGENATNGIPDETLLEQARAIIQEAIDTVSNDTSKGAARARNVLSVERATIYGFLAEDRVRRGASAEDVWAAYETARLAARSAVGVSDEYVPLDVSLWIPLDLLEKANLPESYRQELAADIYSVLDRVDPENLSPAQRERFDRRRLVSGELLGSAALSEDAFNSLIAQGSTAGYFLRARSMGPKLLGSPNDVVSAENYAAACSAAQYLRQNYAALRSDQRCLRYLLQCCWIESTRTLLLRGERAPLPVTEGERRKFLDIIDVIQSTSTVGQDTAMIYLEAVLSWLLEDYRHAVDTWRKIARDTEFYDLHRVVRRNLITGADGKPLVFSGRIERVLASHADLRIEGSNQIVQALERDFGDLTYGRTIPNFAIAFNYIGPIADPISRKPTER
jgi:hypothetical protein